MTRSPQYLTALFVTSLAVDLVLVACARRLAIASGFVARPNPIVKSHRVPVPYLGGAAFVLGYAAMLGIACRLMPALHTPGAIARAGAALALAAFGTIDDRRPLGPMVKLLVQAVICAGYLLCTNRDPGRFSFIFQLLVLLTLVNAYNLIDVMDGLLCLLTVTAILGLLAVAGRTAGRLEIELMLGLAATVALFMFNRPPARIYSGDAGSLALGFLIGAWCLSAAEGAPPAQVVAMLGVVGVPLLELALIVPARILRGRNPLRGSPDHFSLRLQDRLGWGPWRVLACTLVLAVLFAIAPLLETRLARVALLAYAAAIMVLALAVWWKLWRLAPQGLPTAAARGGGPGSSPVLPA